MEVADQPVGRRRCGVCLFELPPNAAPIENTSARGETGPPGDLDLYSNEHENPRRPDFNLNTLELSERRGCRCCMMLRGTLLRLNDEMSLGMNPMDRMYWGTYFSGRLDWIPGRYGADVKVGRGGVFELFSPVSTPWLRTVNPQTAVADLPSGHTASLVSFNRLKSWLCECLESHTLCDLGQNVPLPHRILEFGRTGTVPTVRLIESSGQVSRYACLSHRWGSSNPLRLTKENREMFKDGIHWSSLSRTFQEAAIVVLNLGLDLLWIDSLCIIQDDDIDWRREAASMSQIYRNAFITISATSAPGSDEGLFAPISSTFQAQKFTSLTGDDLYFRPTFRHPNIWRTQTELDLFPLLARGWVLQERLLSPRTIHYTRNELYWECYEDTWCECQSPNTKIYDSRPKINYYIQLLKGDGSFWQEMVQIYASLDLTFSKDKLLAISGIAKTFHEQCGSLLGRYLAGLWEKRLDLDFLWTCDVPVSRPQPLAAPSWSWASVTGSIQFHANPVSANDSRTCRLIQFLDAKIVPKGPDEYGEVASGDLIISGLLVRGKLCYSLPVVAPSSSIYDIAKVEIPRINFRDITSRNSGEMRGLLTQREPVPDNKVSLNADYAFWEPGDAFIAPEADVYCLKTGVNISYGPHQSEHWMVLRRLNREGRDVFERFGIIQPPQEVVQGVWTERMTIV